MNIIVRFAVNCFAAWLRGWREAWDECKAKKIISLDKYQKFRPARKRRTAVNA